MCALIPAEKCNILRPIRSVDSVSYVQFNAMFSENILRCLATQYKGDRSRRASSASYIFVFLFIWVRHPQSNFLSLRLYIFFRSHHLYYSFLHRMWPTHSQCRKNEINIREPTDANTGKKKMKKKKFEGKQNHSDNFNQSFHVFVFIFCCFRRNQEIDSSAFEIYFLHLWSTRWMNESDVHYVSFHFQLIFIGPIFFLQISRRRQYLFCLNLKWYLTTAVCQWLICIGRTGNVTILVQ